MDLLSNVKIVMQQIPGMASDEPNQGPLFEGLSKVSTVDLVQTSLDKCFCDRKILYIF
jgi:hypothetical protein